MLFSNTNKDSQTIPLVSTLQGNIIEVVHTYKYLGILCDDSPTFKPHIDNLVNKLKLKLGFFPRNKMCFFFKSKRVFVKTKFLAILD